MRFSRQILRLVSLTGLLLLLGACAYDAALQRLSPAEQTSFRIYRKAMTNSQVRTYLSKETPAARAAYLDELGLTRRFQALDPEDQTSVLAGYIRKGMSADALRFLWGEPYLTEGRTGHYEQWYYLGSSQALLELGSTRNTPDTIVFVYLVDDRVDWWIETTPAGVDVSEPDGRFP